VHAAPRLRFAREACTTQNSAPQLRGASTRATGMSGAEGPSTLASEPAVLAHGVNICVFFYYYSGGESVD